MLHFDPALLRSFTVCDVFDPDELGDDSLISRRLPSHSGGKTYRLRNPGVRNRDKREWLSRLAIRREGALTIGYVASRFGTDVGIIGDGVRRLFLNFSLSGSIALQAGPDTAAVSAGSSGLVYRGAAGTRLRTTDDSSRITIQIDEARLLRVLEALLDDGCPECPSFAPEVNWADPVAAPIVRMARHLIDEIGEPLGLLAVAPALETFTDTLAHLLLARLPHSYSERLRAPQSPAIPRQLRRAEAFIEAHAGQPISVADIAAAAGCGARALQLAFRRFRDTTPVAALQDARLRAVRAALGASDAPTAVIARAFGFSNASRFRAAFRERFGESPRSTR